MNNEYGIACLLDENSTRKLQDGVPFFDKKNIPHISLFQFKCNNLSVLKNMNNYISNISISTIYMTSAIKIVEGNIFLDIADDSSLQHASNRCAEYYSAINHNILPLSQINISKLETTKMIYVKKYGIYWIKENFNPHITLSYQSEFQCNVKINIPKSVNVLSLNIYSIDDLGRIINMQPI